MATKTRSKVTAAKKTAGAQRWYYRYELDGETILSRPLYGSKATAIAAGEAELAGYEAEIAAEKAEAKKKAPARKKAPAAVEAAVRNAEKAIAGVKSIDDFVAALELATDASEAYEAAVFGSPELVEIPVLKSSFDPAFEPAPAKPVRKRTSKRTTAKAETGPLKFLAADFPDGYQCRVCGEVKHLEAFPKRSAKRGIERPFRQSRCRRCRSIANGHLVEADAAEAAEPAAEAPKTKLRTYVAEFNRSADAAEFVEKLALRSGSGMSNVQWIKGRRKVTFEGKADGETYQCFAENVGYYGSPPLGPVAKLNGHPTPRSY